MRVRLLQTACFLICMLTLWFGVMAQKNPTLFVQTGLDGFSLAAAISPDGKVLATGASDNAILIWESDSGTELGKLYGHTGSIEALAFSPDGKFLASASRDKTVRIWNVSNGQTIRVLTGHPKEIISVAFSTNGHLVASGDRWGNIKLWNADTGQLLRTLQSDDRINLLGFNSSDQTFISASSATLKMWRVADGKLMQTIKRTAPRQDAYDGRLSAFNAGNKLVAVATYDNKLEVFDSETGKQLKFLTGRTKYLRSLGISNDGKLLAARGSENSADTFEIWDIETGKLIRTFTDENASFDGETRFFPDGRILAADGWRTKIIDAESGKTLRLFRVHSYDIESVDFSSDGKLLATGTGNGDGRIKVWGLVDNEPLRTFKGVQSSFQPAVFSPDGQSIARVNYDHKVEIWNVGAGTAKSLISAAYDNDNKLAFSPDGKFLAYFYVYNNSIELIDLNKGYGDKKFTAADSLLSMSFSPAGDMLAAGGRDNLVYLWKVDNDSPLRTFSGHTDIVDSVDFSPDGRTIASGSFDKTVKLWNVGSGTLRLTLKGHTDLISAVKFSPTGKILATGSFDNTVRLWDPVNGRLLHTLKGHFSGITSVKFNPKGTIVATGSYDDKTILWDANTGQQLCTLISLDDNDWVVFTPAGKFDSSAGGRQYLIWRLGNDLFSYKPVAAYEKEFYYPKLLEAIMTGKYRDVADTPATRPVLH